jgi:membrane associated rhomboid family serine protease
MIQAYLHFAPVASIIFALTIGISLFIFNKPEQHRELMLHPYSIMHGRRYHTLITSGFIHADLPHLILNMVTFYFFAFSLELFMVAKAGVVGHILFAVLYLLSIVLADMYSVFRHKNNPGFFSLGASGAIAAVMFSYILFDPGSELGTMFFPVLIPAPIFAVLYMIFTYYSSRKQYDNINHDAHLWGAVAGIVLTIIFFPGVLPDFIQEVQMMIGRYLPAL